MSGYDRFASVYDRLTGNVGYAQRADYLFMLLKNEGIETGTLLDLACGTGSLSVALCEKGFEVIGVDGSFEMLSVAREKCTPYGDKILLLCQDMTELDLFGTIDCAVCSLDSINHLTEEADVYETFRLVSLFMNQGGIFVFDVNTVHKHKNVLADNTFIYEEDDVFCVWQNTYYEEDDSVEIFLDIFTENQDGSYTREQESFCERAYSDAMLTDMLEMAGFSVQGRFAELTTDAPADDAERVYYVCKKVTPTGTTGEKYE